MATVCARPATIASRNSATPPPQLSLNTSSRGTPAAVPNKHLPVCSPGPQPLSQESITPPASPPSPTLVIEHSSPLYPPNAYSKVKDDPPVYAITGDDLHSALDHIASQPLPEPKQVFPWLHGLHPENSLQLAFFIARRKTLRRTPKCIRGLTIVKAGGDLNHSKIKGALAPEEFLLTSKTSSEVAHFMDMDPKDGFSVRNFQIQACKMATVSDVVVYGDERTPREEVKKLAQRIASAQRAWRHKVEKGAEGTGEKPEFNTFILQDNFYKLQTEHPDIIAYDADGRMTGHVMDFFFWERLEMHTMSTASEIAPNVWLGPTPDPSLVDPSPGPKTMAPELMAPKPADYDVMIEATDLAQMPDHKTFKILDSLLKHPENAIPHIEFPGSGSIMPPTWSQAEVDALMETCAWIYRTANGVSPADRNKRKDSKVDQVDSDGDSIMLSPSDNQAPAGKKILIHCTDGYTESSLLAIAYYMYANCKPVHEAWLELHCEEKRNFFAYPTDVALLTAIQPRILQASPAYVGDIASLVPDPPGWLSRMDGSLPSRVLDYMYLGNLGHANNTELLRELGIGQVLSVGEQLTWSEEEKEKWEKDTVMFVNNVQDNGVDPLTEEFERCLEFIEKGRKAGTATLVHCRVGVSRSATICIAEVMNELGLSFPRAYCFVRARRLNVIIQPHLRFSYELLKWEGYQAKKRGKPLKRELEWGTIAREIAAMNKPYSRQ